MTDVNKAVEAVNVALAEMRVINDEKDEQLKQFGVVQVDMAEKLAKAEEALARAEDDRKRIEKLEAAGQLIDKAEDESDTLQKQHRDAWYAYMGSPKDPAKRQALYEIQQKDVTLSTTGGGYAIPTLVGGVISELIMDTSPMRQHARVVSTENQLTRWLVADNNSTSTWVGAGSARSQTTEPLMRLAA